MSWLEQRLADAAMWPINLLRDLPARAGRLAGALAAGRAVGRGAGAAWVEGLLVALFDLLGGPELVELGLRLATQTSPLSDGEIKAAEAVLGRGALRFRDVRIAQGGILRWIFAANGQRAFALWHTVNMPSGEGKGRADLSLLVHELTHVRQYERRGTAYIPQALHVQRQLGRRAYDYGGPAGLLQARAAGKQYRDYNREQQGQIAQDYYMRAQRQQDTSAYEPFIAELRDGAL
jgi:hypothetical protein